MAAEAAQKIVFEEPGDFFEVGSEEPGLRIYLRYDLFRALDEYAMRDTSRELAALLVGQVEENGGQACLVVEDAIEIGVGDEREGRFSPRVWQHARRVARTRYANKVIVGWYHTHPGTGLDLSAEEREVHKGFFPEAWQVMYVVDPVSRDRNFYRNHEGRLGGVRGFRIFGKEAVNLREKAAAPPVAAPAVAQPKPEEALRERYLERSLEKIIRSLRRPPVRPIDLLIVALLCANLLVTLFRPAPTAAKVELGPVMTAVDKVGAKVTNLSAKLQKLERHLAELQVLDAELAQPTPAPSGAPPEGNPTPQLGLKEHLVKEGDTLSTISEHYYGSSAHSSGLAKYNKLKNGEIFPGDRLKIPPKEALQ